MILLWVCAVGLFNTLVEARPIFGLMRIGNLNTSPRSAAA